MKSNLNFDNDFSSLAGPGAPLSRQISKSLQHPQNLTHYHSVFSANNRQSGFLELKIGGEQRHAQWAKKWFVFEDGSLNYSDGPLAKQDEYQFISMERVISFRADSNAKLPVISVVTLDGTFYLRVSHVEEMRHWLFSFQKSVALVITKLLYKRQRGLQEDSRIWGSALGDANGEGMNFARLQLRGGLKRGQLVLEAPSAPDANGLPSPASPFVRKTSVYIENQAIPSSYDQTRDSPNRQAYSLSSSRMMAISPAIPISMGQMLREVSKTNIASSYKEETTVPISAYMKRVGHTASRRGSHRHAGSEDEDNDEVDRQAVDSDNESERNDDDDNDSLHHSDQDDDDGMMFDMDENVEERAEAHQHQHQQPSNHQQQNRSNISSLSYDNQSGSYANRSRKPTTGGSSVATSLSSTRSSGITGDFSRHVASSSSYVSWMCGSCSHTGIRDKNEDRLVQEPCVLLSPEEKAKDVGAHYFGGGETHSCGFFAVYDGHGGDEASQFLVQEMHTRLIKHDLFHSNTEEAIVDVCKEVDIDFLNLCVRLRKGSGTTALGAILQGSRLTVFNIGDSMAVLCSSGMSVEMSNSHKPGRPDEAERISKANGWITEEKELLMGRLHRMDLNDPLAVDRAQNMSWTTIHRVCGEISVSRSIGDPDYKNLVPGMKQEDWYFRWPEGHSQVMSLLRMGLIFLFR
jgi:serine/threonine protein phosphatase PrpC